MNRCVLLSFVCVLLSSLSGWSSARAQSLKVTVRATDQSYREVPLTVMAPAGWLPTPRAPKRGETPCQIEPNSIGMSNVTFIVRDLPRGKSRTYRLVPAPAAPASGSGVEARRVGKNAEFRIDGRLFTRYDTTTGPNKPYFYPVNMPDGRQVVRHWPVEKRDGETDDHPHHRGLWFTHGDVNGVDYWSEGPGTGSTVHTDYDALRGGPVYGLMKTRTAWIDPKGKKVAEDYRTVRVYDNREGRLMDFIITVTATNAPLTWGDTKEGTFGMRLADSMRAITERGKPVGGHILNANGLKDGDAWGKPSPWCDYSGPLEGRTAGVAIFDNPFNFRHPTTWHVRDYGLFAANPFGLHDFDPARKNDPKAGAHTLSAYGSITFFYRLYFHDGTAEEAHVADAWNAYQNPPAATVVPPKGQG